MKEKQVPSWNLHGLEEQLSGDPRHEFVAQRDEQTLARFRIQVTEWNRLALRWRKHEYPLIGRRELRALERLRADDVGELPELVGFTTREPRCPDAPSR